MYERFGVFNYMIKSNKNSIQINFYIHPSQKYRNTFMIATHTQTVQAPS